MAGNTATEEKVDIVTVAFQRADQLQVAKEKLYEQIAANRRFLRDLAIQGLLTDAQSNKVLELYPPKRHGESE